MDGEHNGTPYYLMDDLGVPLFLETPTCTFQILKSSWLTAHFLGPFGMEHLSTETVNFLMLTGSGEHASSIPNLNDVGILHVHYQNNV